MRIPGPYTTLFGGMTSRLLFWMSILALAPMTIMAGQGYHCARQAILDKTDDHLLSLAVSRAALVTTWFAQRFSEIDVVSSSPSVARCCAHFASLSQEEIDGEITVMLRSVVRRVDSYDEIAVLGAEGDRIAAVSRDGTKFNAEETFARIDNALAHITTDDDMKTLPPELDPEGNVVLFIGRQIHAGGTRQGLVIARLNLTRSLEPLLQDRNGMGKTGRTYLAWVNSVSGSPAGPENAAQPMQILTNPIPNADRIALRRPPHDAIAAQGLSKRIEQTIYTDNRGNVVWARLAPVTPYNMEIVVEQDAAEASAWLDTLLLRAVITGACTFLAFLVVALWTSRGLSKPLRALARVAHNVRIGKAHDRMGPLKGAEAEEVRRAFNSMLDELATKQRELVRSATLASIGELSSSVVHEMRNPLSSVRMNLQALLRIVGTDPDNRELAAIAIAQTDRIERMLNDLLQYGRPVEVQRQPVRFDELLGPVASLTAEKANEKQVRIDVQDNLLGAVLDVDPELLCRALTNLLVNGIEATPQGGVVRVRALKQGETDESALIEIADGGSGISKAAFDRVFQPFFTTKTTGTGLGLANVKKIVELHGGSVSARNARDGGAVFTLCLPLAKRAAS